MQPVRRQIDLNRLVPMTHPDPKQMIGIARQRVHLPEFISIEKQDLADS
jgi:hypothetical protein